MTLPAGVPMGHGPCAEGAVLICPGAASRRGLPDGGSTRVLWGFNSVAGVIGARLRAGRELAAAAEAVAALSRGGRLVMRLPQPGPGTGRRLSRRLRSFRR